MPVARARAIGASCRSSILISSHPSHGITINRNLPMHHGLAAFIASYLAVQLLAGATLHAQPARPIEGTVVDAESHAPIGGATVFAVDGKNRTYTASSGRFRLPVPVGDHVISGSSIGYKDTFMTLAGGAPL